MTAMVGDGLPVLYELLAVKLEINQTVMHMIAATGRGGNIFNMGCKHLS